MSSSMSVGPGGTLRKIKNHGVQLLKRTDRDDLFRAQIYLKTPIIISMNNLWKVSLQQVIQSGMTTVFGLHDVRQIG